MKVFDEILRRESNLDIRGTDNVDLIVIPEKQAKQLMRELKEEFEMSDEITHELLEGYAGSKIIVVKDNVSSSFSLYQEIKPAETKTGEINESGFDA